MCLLVRFEVSELFANTLTANGKYFGHYRESFAQSIQMNLA